MLNTKEIYEIKTEKQIMAANQTDATISLRGNQNMDKVLGVNILIWENDQATGLVPIAELSANPLVSIQESTGRVLIPLAPYQLLRASNEVSFSEKFVEFEGVKGHDQDINVSINTRGIDKAVTVWATAVYSRKKI